MTKLSGGSIDDIVAEHIPLKRMGTKGDIALTAVFLATYVGAHPRPQCGSRCSRARRSRWHAPQ